MPKIFISYRHQDSSGHTGWLHDRLAAEFGRDQIFLDFDTIAVGVDFVQRINDAVGECDALIAVIGDEWLGAVDPSGNRRLDDPADFVRLEIAAGLERNVKVIPALVAGATPPRADELPEPIKDLANRQAIELTDSRWDYDIGRLIALLREIDGSDGDRPAERSERGLVAFLHRHRVAAPATLAAIAAVGVAAVLLLSGGGDTPAPSPATAAAPSVVVSDFEGKESAMPETFNFSVNGDLIGHDLSWSRWGDRSATATGTFEVREYPTLNTIALGGTLLFSEVRQCLGKSYYTQSDVTLAKNAPFQPDGVELPTPCSQ